MNRITMPPRKAQIPAKTTHLHECGHWCACLDHNQRDCRTCRLKAFNARAGQ
ncbi:MAG TPA: hypothetical protein VGU71_22480 [Candidatus Dormibacteraeota bacterium]|nr:hypothetical protein [Candidatus Dormibacteraeota bacterium]